ncbi:Bax Inhibitor family protein [Taphrina deformans PYCC 5710]|uniref:Bax Inhibitor family protein n=1 Tax=Taphrina deformans (strain PYCC 5710 / ATCC 11124 / CBS 356.35 / IMI 108563 / JCM 9778 / NBRC 8474) TaxID=1097556 RepID=R4X801_TAPDE|nr:Bax Inhibitor family protein [Taphrina deformans PYCC 5710]|eukprot:CCG81377.1 Bax Inhibitor family protein [Taphrina deformans PYCC 5710]
MASYQPVSTTAPPAYDPTKTTNTAGTPGYGSTSLDESRPVNAVDPDDDFKFGTTVDSCDLIIRMGFIRKVYTILLTQIISTTIIGAFMMSNESVKTWVQANHWMMLTAVIGSFASLLALFWKRQSYPTNFYLLALFTTVEAYTVGTVTSYYDSKIVLEALVLTTGVFLALTLFTFQTKYDFVSWGSFLYMALWGMVMVGFVGMFFPHNSGFELAYSGFGCLVFSGYILYDTQMIIKHHSVDEYIMASVSLYLDLINLFLNILRILNQMNNNNN